MNATLCNKMQRFFEFHRTSSLIFPRPPSLLFYSDPIRLARMVDKVEWLKRITTECPDPRGLAPWVKEVVRLSRQSGVAGQTDSPSRQAGWGLGFDCFFRASCSTSFTIHTRWMGSSHDLCRTTSPPEKARAREFPPAYHIYILLSNVLNICRRFVAASPCPATL